MSSLLQIVSIDVLNNQGSRPSDPFLLEVKFEAYESIADDVEWELVFVATDGKEENDQLLDSLAIGPIRDGLHKFTFEAPAPDLTRLRAEDFADVTVLQLRTKYREQLFSKISWFIVHMYNAETDPELLENPPPQPIIEKLERRVITDDVRVTQFPIKWGDVGTQTAEDSNTVNNELDLDDQVAEVQLMMEEHSVDASDVREKFINGKLDEEMMIAEGMGVNAKVAGNSATNFANGRTDEPVMEALTDMTNSN